MAGVRLRKSVRGSTLVEVLISMVIIVVVFGVGMMIFTNVMRYSIPEQRVKAVALLKDELIKTENEKTFSDGDTTAGDYVIEKKVTLYSSADSLIIIHLEAIDRNQQKIAELTKIVSANP